jgi:predicted DNA-binding transcriptional regulator YafY
MRWFLFGKSNDYETITNLALDRIENIEIVTQAYMDSTIDFNEYFEDVVGVTVPNEKIETIILEISESILPYLKTKPIQGSQIVKQENGKNYIQLKVIPNYELETLILSYGEKIKVVKPSFLVEKLKDRIDKMKNNY